MLSLHYTTGGSLRQFIIIKAGLPRWPLIEVAAAAAAKARPIYSSVLLDHRIFPLTVSYIMPTTEFTY